MSDIFLEQAISWFTANQQGYAQGVEKCIGKVGRGKKRERGKKDVGDLSGTKKEEKVEEG